ncbi:MAG: dihydropteroate synthase, partial [Bacteriovoracaceae bacterium]
MNITPNSISEGRKYKKPGHSLNQFSQFLKDFDMVDVGAESTAPFNAPIDAQTELSRLEAFFYPLFEMVPDPQGVISLDTYRPEVFYEAAMWIRKAWPKTRLIFNDVSGKVDDDLLELFKEDLSFDYVLSHNLCPERDLCSDHMQYCHAL